MATITKKTTTRLAKPLVCKHCKAEHFEYQLSCKRCNSYLNGDDTPGMANPLAAAVLLLALGGIAYEICRFVHLF